MISARSSSKVRGSDGGGGGSFSSCRGEVTHRSEGRPLRRFLLGLARALGVRTIRTIRTISGKVLDQLFPRLCPNLGTEIAPPFVVLGMVANCSISELELPGDLGDRQNIGPVPPLRTNRLSYDPFLFSRVRALRPMERLAGFCHICDEPAALCFKDIDAPGTANSAASSLCKAAVYPSSRARRGCEPCELRTFGTS